MRLAALLCLVLVTIAPAGLAAATLYGTTGFGPGVNSTLVEVNPSTGALVRTIGQVGYTVVALTFDPTTGRLYGGTRVNDTFNGLIEINLTTGIGTPVGVDDWGFASDQPVVALTVNRAGEMFGWIDGAFDDLVSINKTTGRASLVGNSGLSTERNGLAFDNNGTLFMMNDLGVYYSVNKATGTTTRINDINSIAHHGDFNPSNALYYGLSTLAVQRSLVVADLAGGAGRNQYTLLPTVNSLHTLAFYKAPDTVFTPEPAALWLLAAGLGAIACRRMRP